jgi:hypothetical protein
MPGVTASVLPFADLVEALNAVHFGQVSGLLEITKQVITLGVDVCGDVMRDLTRCVTEAISLVVGRRSGPKRVAVKIDLVRTPKPNMMAFSWVVADRLFEGKVLFAPPHKEITHWSIIIRPPEDRGLRNLEAALQGERVSRIPLGRQQDFLNVRLHTD